MDFIRTSIDVLNIINGGGLRTPSVVEPWGAMKSGKSTFVYETGGLFHKDNPKGRILLVDPELAHDRVRLEQIYEWDWSRVEISPSRTIESGITSIMHFIEKNEDPLFIAYDTISVCPTNNEYSSMKKYLEDTKPGEDKGAPLWSGGMNERQRVIKYYLTQLITRLYGRNVIVMLPNQVYTKIGTYQGGFTCFTGDTRISLLNGTEVPIKDLVGLDEFWVYSCDEEGNIVPGLATNCRKTGELASILKITLDNGEIIRCTYNHKFMMRDGSYKEAQCLQPEDSLMPLYRRDSDTMQCYGYEIVSIEPDGHEDVYDFTVDKYHNFALSAGVFVHNSGGGEAFKHDLHYSFYFETEKNLYDTTEKDVLETIKRLTISKSRFCPEIKKIPVYISIENGGTIDTRKSTILMAYEYGMIKQKGSWYFIEGYENDKSLRWNDLIESDKVYDILYQKIKDNYMKKYRLVRLLYEMKDSTIKKDDILHEEISVN